MISLCGSRPRTHLIVKVDSEIWWVRVRVVSFFLHITETQIFTTIFLGDHHAQGKYQTPVPAV